jgi:hypothetical protein
MFSLAAIKALQIYGIAIAVSMVVAVLIKLLVVLTSQVKPAAKATVAVQKPVELLMPAIPEEVVAAISVAVSILSGPHRILHIAESKRSWAREGRIAQHSHQPRY